MFSLSWEAGFEHLLSFSDDLDSMGACGSIELESSSEDLTSGGSMKARPDRDDKFFCTKGFDGEKGDWSDFPFASCFPHDGGQRFRAVGIIDLGDEKLSMCSSPRFEAGNSSKVLLLFALPPVSHRERFGSLKSVKPKVGHEDHNSWFPRGLLGEEFLDSNLMFGKEASKSRSRRFHSFILLWEEIELRRLDLNSADSWQMVVNRSLPCDEASSKYLCKAVPSRLYVTSDDDEHEVSEGQLECFDRFQSSPNDSSSQSRLVSHKATPDTKRFTVVVVIIYE
jgi:hypothetical protein